MAVLAEVLRSPNGNTKRNMVCTYKREVLAQMSFFLRLEIDKYFGTLRINGRYLRKCTFSLGGESKSTSVLYVGRGSTGANVRFPQAGNKKVLRYST